MINGLLAPLRYNKQGYEKIYDLVCRYKFPVSFMLVGSLFKPKAKQKFIDYGYHSWSHKALTYISDYEVEKEIRNIYKAISFSAPMNLIDDPLAPSRILRILEKGGYKIAVWAGPTIRDKRRNIVVVAPRKKIAEPKSIKGVKCVYISNFFDGKSSTKEVKFIINEIKSNANKGAIYCLTTHEFSNRNMKNFEYIVKELLKMQDKKKIKLMNLRQLVE